MGLWKQAMSDVRGGRGWGGVGGGVAAWASGWQGGAASRRKSASPRPEVYIAGRSHHHRKLRPTPTEGPPWSPEAPVADGGASWPRQIGFGRGRRATQWMGHRDDLMKKMALLAKGP
ncbi:hypothetical protein Taro_031862 [Colocasia esculenta]|uniref:Uncharacterized protein n=1 Tax=Colocasia esculenta TaxID=4460 RepID=A0A843VJW2_COLES|nr:hypothetical protein [Colocasia esculenta]